ncbi:hypothetical protein [Hymenobacter pini]|uniref:hypothetical protein n=1 Tax=Hymenobacter pini TaxID=2880879 RepID=UPI001CF34D5D|nr:hypothetical protein [Hymenobacter pini]MCA8831777.1 hypothetical protein [Hymenobacter pini]
MNPKLSFADVVVVPTRSALTFTVRCSPVVPAYQELILEDAVGNSAHWVISQPLEQLAKRPVLLWLMSAPPYNFPLECLEAGTVQSVATQHGADSDLRAGLTQGRLRLTFNGQRLRGYYRLQCLPTGCGQLWQLSPISQS